MNRGKEMTTAVKSVNHLILRLYTIKECLEISQTFDEFKNKMLFIENIELLESAITRYARTSENFKDCYYAKQKLKN